MFEEEVVGFSGFTAFMSNEGGCHVQQIQRQAHMGHGPRHYFLEREIFTP